MIRRSLPLLPLLLLALPCMGQERPSRESTKEERDRLLKTVSLLEQDPLGPKAKEARQWAVKFLAEASDIQVEIGPVALAVAEKAPDKDGYRAMFGLQFIIACGADVIRHEGKQDRVRTNTYALKSCLAMYKNFVKDHPERKIDGFEELQKKNDKELKAYVEEVLQKGKRE